MPRSFKKLLLTASLPLGEGADEGAASGCGSCDAFQVQFVHECDEIMEGKDTMEEGKEERKGAERSWRDADWR